MSRYTRTRARRCGDKVQHATRRQALDHVYRLVRQGAAPGAMEPYRCGGRGAHWHVGHRSPRHRRSA